MNRILAMGVQLLILWVSLVSNAWSAGAAAQNAVAPGIFNVATGLPLAQAEKEALDSCRANSQAPSVKADPGVCQIVNRFNNACLYYAYTRTNDRGTGDTHIIKVSARTDDIIVSVLAECKQEAGRDCALSKYCDPK